MVRGGIGASVDMPLNRSPNLLIQPVVMQGRVMIKRGWVQGKFGQEAIY
jgi:hypothetical protein